MNPKTLYSVGPFGFRGSYSGIFSECFKTQDDIECHILELGSLGLNAVLLGVVGVWGFRDLGDMVQRSRG